MRLVDAAEAVAAIAHHQVDRGGNAPHATLGDVEQLLGAAPDLRGVDARLALDRLAVDGRHQLLRVTLDERQRVLDVVQRVADLVRQTAGDRLNRVHAL